MENTQKSYARGSTDVPLLDLTIGQLLDQAAAQHGANEALVCCHQDIRWSYQKLKTEVEHVAAGFIALGLNRGDRVGVWSPNNAEWVVSLLATAKAGLILVPINPAYRLSELEYSLNKVACRMLILADRFKSSDYVKMVQALAPEITVCKPGQLRSAKLHHLEFAVVIGSDTPAGFMNFADIANHATDHEVARLKAIENELSPDDPINIQFTSGTTGFPKGATLTHRNILNNGFNTAACQKFTCKDRLCIPVPLYHCFGIVLAVLACVSHAATMVFPDEAFEPESVLTTVERERCTALYGVPTMFIAELALPNISDFDLSSLRTGVMAGSPCPVETMKQVISVMNMRDVTIAYGMTETSPVSTQSNPNDSIEKRVNSVGRVHPHVEIKVIDEAGNTLPRGIQGEFCTRGYSVMKGYWGDEDATCQTIDVDGWMHTGDLATMDADGYVNITGRVKDMIIRGGENIYPREIEEFLYRHQHIQEVQVFGVPDEKYGEAICAWIIHKPGESLSGEDVKEFCKGQIAHYKVPLYVRFVDEFPMTVTGKIQKFVMRDRMIEELDLKFTQTA